VPQLLPGDSRQLWKSCSPLFHFSFPLESIMPRAFEVKAGVAAAAEKQLLSAVAPLGATPTNPVGRPHQFNVTWIGKTAFASKQEQKIDGFRTMSATINYPFIDDAAVLTRAEADLFGGYTLHEIGHLLYTDYEALRFNSRDKLTHAIWNGLEDPRIETAVINSGVGGARVCFEQLLSKLLADAGRDFNPADPRCVPFALAVLGRCHLWGYEHDLLRNVYDRLPAKIAEFYRYAMDKLSAAPLDLSGTKYLLGVARELAAMLRNSMPAEPEMPDMPGAPQPSEGPEELNDADDEPMPSTESADNYELEFSEDEESDEADGSEGGDEAGEESDDDEDGEAGEAGDDDLDDEDLDDLFGDGDADDEGEDDEAGGDDGDDAGSAGDEDGDAGDQSFSERPYDASGWGDDPGEDVMSPELDIDKLTKRINKRNKKAGETGNAPKVTPGQAQVTSLQRGGRKIERRGDELVEVFHYTEDRVTVYARHKPQVNRNAALRGAITNLLVAPEMCGWDNGFSSGRFDRRSVSRMMAGNENVFERRWESEGIDTAVSILIDCSGSMVHARIGAAHDVTNMLAEIFDRAGVSFGVYGFTSGGGRNYYKLYSETDINGNSASSNMPRRDKTSDPAVLYDFKPYGKKLSACREAMDAIFTTAGGCTPDLSAINYVGNELLLRPERRKIMFVISDGQGDDRDVVRARVECLQKAGIDVIGIGIEYNVDDVFDYCVTVNSVSELSAASFKQIKEALERKQVGRRVM
jgi:cobalamin biosynthesis protein CobT